MSGDGGCGAGPDVSAAELRGYEQAYTEVYETYCRRVDPDIEGHGVAELVGQLLTAIECEIEKISPEVAESLAHVFHPTQRDPQ